MSEYSFQPIGFIESCYKERFGTPRQSSLVPDSWAVLRLRPGLCLEGCFEGLEGFSHVWLVFVFNQNTNKGVKAKIHPPRLDGQKVGVFATRSPHRPNPIGLSAVKLERVERDALYLSGVDLLDGTPVLDIKPYLPSADLLPDATAGWTQARPERTLSVEINEKARAEIRDFADRGVVKDPVRLERLIRQTLELDPRPGFYKGSEDRPNPYTDVYGFRLEDLNIIYKMVDRQATVIGVEKWVSKDQVGFERRSFKDHEIPPSAT